MTNENLLPAAYIAELLETVRRPASDRALTAALIELSDWLDGSRRDPTTPLSVADQATLREVATALRPLRHGLADRMQRPAILASRQDTIVSGCFVDAPSFQCSAVHWKPERAMWSSPAVGPGISAWTLRTETTHDATRHGHVVVLETPPVTVPVDSLENADRLVADFGGAVNDVWRGLHRDGVWRVDFSWVCVLEAEMDAFQGYRAATAFPCGLGVESSLWLRVPVQHSSVPAGDGGQTDSMVADWFTYQ